MCSTTTAMPASSGRGRRSPPAPFPSSQCADLLRTTLCGRPRTLREASRRRKEKTMLSFADIQGTILRGYTDPQVRFFLLRIDDTDGARAFCSKLLPGSGAPLTITTAQRWQERPP